MKEWKRGRLSFRKRWVIWINARGILKLTGSGLLLLLAVFLFVYEPSATPVMSNWALPLSGKVIAVDPGHGGPDGGAISKEGTVEKDINLNIALYLRDYLQQAGAIVVMTREEDKDLADPGTKGYSRRKTEDLVRRVQLVQDVRADLLLSIHLNSIASSKWSGAQTFYNPNKEGSAALAVHIQNELRSNLENTDRLAAENTSFFPLKAVSMPGALIEVGFLSNPAEARLMDTEDYQKRVAAAIYQGVLRYSAGEDAETP